MSENRVLAEIEVAASHFKICVLPRNPKKLACSIWSMPDPAYHVGVMWRQNTGALKQGNRFIRFGMPGNGDFAGWLFRTAAQHAQAFEIEAKQVGKLLSPNQQAKCNLARSTGLLWEMANSYDQACALFQSWGLRRNA